jgi:hypothetical protein
LLEREPVQQETGPATPEYLKFQASKSTVDDLVRSLASGMTGTLADEFAAAASRVTGVGGQGEGTYSERLAAERARDESIDPSLRIAGEVGGGMALAGAGLLPKVAEGTSLVRRAVQGAKAGAGYGTVYGFGSGEGMEDRLKSAVTGAAVGGVTGAAVPAAITGTAAAVRGGKALLGKATTPFRGAVNPEAEAQRRVRIALERDQRLPQPALSEAEATAAQARGQPVMNIDRGGETTRALARSAANTSPEGRQTLTSAISERYAGQGERIGGFLKGFLGHRVTAGGELSTREALQAAARKANKPAYAKAYQEGEAVWSDTLEQISQAPDVQAAIRRATRTGANRAAADGFKPVKNPFVTKDEKLIPAVQPDGSRALPSLQFWDHVKRNLDDQIATLDRAGRKSAAADARDLKNQLVAELDSVVPSYAEARAGAARFFGAQDALEAGDTFISSTMAPAEAAAALKKMSPAEKKLFEEGFVTGLLERISRISDNRNVVSAIYGSPQARQKIGLAVGAEKAKELEGFLRVESLMDRARSAVQGNSTTARQLFELGLAGGMAGGGVAGIQAFTGQDIGWQAIAIASVAGAFARRKIDQRVAQSVAEKLVSGNPETMQKAVQHVVRSKRMMEALRSLDIPVAVGAAQQTTREATQ